MEKQKVTYKAMGPTVTKKILVRICRSSGNFDAALLKVK